MSGGKIVIKIRASNFTREDQVISCEPEWTVKQLKTAAHATADNVDILQLKYIYGGRYLTDDMVLKSIFKCSSEPYVIQMLASGKTKQHMHHIQSNPEIHDASTPSVNTTQPELRHRHTYPDLTSFGHVPHNWSTENLSAYYQHPAWQQYNQAMTQYMQYYQAAYTGQPITMAAAPIPHPGVTETHPNVPPPVNDNQPNNIAPVQAEPAREQNPPMNAQGGFAAADDDDQQNDWLDVLFTMLRGGFFLSIIYFYSTFYRLVFVCLLSLFIYIYQAGFFRPQRRAAPVETPPNPQPQRQRNHTDDNNNSEESAPESNDDGIFEEAPPEPPSLFDMAWCFVRTFFTSLIPQGPPVAN